jgi:rhamnosyltransferase
MLISIIIRSYNEEKFIGALLDKIKIQTCISGYEVILIDSGSTDRTIEIAKMYSFVKIFSIKKSQFTYGFALNFGISKSHGSIIAVISAHCLPKNEFWLKNLTQPIVLGTADITFGRQIGDHNTRTSEMVIFKNLYPSFAHPNHFFPNNANAAYLGKIFQLNKFDESVIALEDITLFSQLKTSRLQYISDAIIYHFHKENNKNVFYRFFRESYVYHSRLTDLNIYHFENTKIFKKVLKNLFDDFSYAIKYRNLIKSLLGILGYRLSQSYGIYLGKKINYIKNNLFHNKIIIFMSRKELNLKKIKSKVGIA